MSELRVDNIVDMGGSGAPQLRKGASVTGISTITQAVVGNATINAGGINATGIITSSSNKFVGDFASGNITAGVMTATSSVVASNITINSGGVNASGIVSATSYIGSGANLTGVGLSIAPLAYNPNVSAVDAPIDTGIGITFNQRVFAGTGNVTLSLVAVGSTLVENFSVGSSVTYNNDADPPNITITPTDTLDANTVYAISYPSGAFTQSGAGGSFVGTAYTFDTGAATFGQLWGSGYNANGELGDNTTVSKSSPVQVPGTTWSQLSAGSNHMSALKSDNTAWAWGKNENGALGQNQPENSKLSSPTQIPGSWSVISAAIGTVRMAGVKTNGTLWTWGANTQGQGGRPSQPTNQALSSPAQVPGTTWTDVQMGAHSCLGLKTDGTLWAWGRSEKGSLGIPSIAHDANQSSPIQVPGTWGGSQIRMDYNGASIKTDGTLWVWGVNSYGNLGQNSRTDLSSPTQIPGTNWNNVVTKVDTFAATKTDGTLWTWGREHDGSLGQNSPSNSHLSSPTQIPGTNWSSVASRGSSTIATKTDGTLWNWGMKSAGKLGQNSVVYFSSPVQIPGTNWSSQQGHQAAGDTHHYIKLA